MVDPILVCLYCGDSMDALTEKQAKLFGDDPDCCDEKMLKVDREKIYTIVKGLDNLKANLEQEILKGHM